METLDKIEVVGEASHENVFIGNHCKSIVSNSEKLCSLVLDEPAFHDHISESFGIYSEHHLIVLSKRFFAKAETLSVKELWTGLGKLTKHFPNETVTRWRNSCFDVLRFFGKAQNIGIAYWGVGRELAQSDSKAAMTVTKY